MDILKAVVDWVMAQLQGFWDWLVSMIPVPAPPAWLTGAASTAAIVMDKAAQLGHWIPWPVAVAVALTVVTIWVVVMGVKVVKWIVQTVASAL